MKATRDATEPDEDASRQLKIFGKHESDSTVHPNRGEANPETRIVEAHVIGGPSLAYRLLPEVETTSPLADVTGRILRNPKLHGYRLGMISGTVKLQAARLRECPLSPEPGRRLRPAKPA